MSKLGENFDVPSENVPDAFGITEERAKELDDILCNSMKNAVTRHSNLEDTTLDHVMSDIMREVDSKTKLTPGEKDMMLLQMGANLGNARNVIGEVRHIRTHQKHGEPEMSEEERAEVKKLHGRLFRMIANMLDPEEQKHKFSDN